MTGKNIISPVIEEITSVKSGVEIERVKTNYQLVNNFYVPSSTQISFTGPNNLITAYSFDHYDTMGNILQTTDIGGVRTTYIWGYNYKYPIARIQNASYSQLTALINETALSVIAAKSEPSASDMQTIRALATGLPNTLLTTFTYKPLVGIASETDPSGRTIYYEYDEFGRLNRVKDEDGRILKEHRYHYATEE